MTTLSTTEAGLFRLLYAAWITAILTGFTIQAKAQTCTIVSSADKVCLGNSVTLSVSPHASDSAWVWDFGDGKSSNQGPSVTYQYSAAGNFTPTLKLYGFGGIMCSSIKSTQIQVVNKPDAYFAITSSDSLCFRNNQFCIRDQSTLGNAPISKRIVIFGDGGFHQSTDMAEDSVCYSYQNPAGGRYSVIMQVFDTNGCEDAYIDSVLIYPKMPGLGYTASYKEGCAATLVVFNNTSSIPPERIKSFKWNFDDNTSNTTTWTNITHTYLTLGPFSPQLIVTDLDNCVDTFTRIKGINSLTSDTTFTITSNGTSCVNSNSFTFESKSLAVVFWRIFDPSGRLLVNSAQNPLSYTFPNCGRYKIRFVINTEVCPYSKDTIIDIYGPNVIIQNDTLKVKNGMQCGVHDTVFFNNPLLDLSCYHQNGPMNRLWNFGDPFAPPCTTDTRNGQFVNMNCNFSKDSSGVRHLYKNGKDSCYKVKLFMTDPIRNCKDSDITTLSLVTPDAGWDSSVVPPRRGAYPTGGPCLNQQIVFHIDELLPKCGPDKVWFLPDSACFPQKWILKDTINKTAPFNYTYNSTCSPSGKVTYGVIVSNGLDQNGHRCYDTAWYHDKIFFQRLANNFTMKSNLSNICNQHTVQFSSADSTQKGVSKALWDFGDGTVQTQLLSTTDTTIKSVSHQYNSSGAFSVILTLYDKNNCPTTAKAQTYLGTFHNFSLNKAQFCLGDSLMIKDSVGYYTASGSILKGNYWYDHTREAAGKELLLWDLGDGAGFVKLPRSPVVKYTAPGNYRIRMLVRDSIGCTDTLTANDTVRVVHLLPRIGTTQTEYLCSPVIILAVDSSKCIDSSAALHQPPYDYISKWEWNWGDDKAGSSLQNPAHFYTSNGQFPIILKILSEKGCVAYDTLPINIQGPRPRFVIVGDTAGCVPFSVTLKNTSGKSMINWIWYFNDTNIYSTQNDSVVSFTYRQPGIYHLRLVGEDTVWNNTTQSFKSCASIFPDTTNNNIIRDVNVLAPPALNIISDSIVCQGTPVLMAHNSPYPYTNYTWEPEPGVFTIKPPLDSTLSYLYAQPGKKRVKLTAYSLSPLSCSDSAFREIDVTQITADFEIKSISESNYEFTNKSSGAVRYEWTFGDPQGENTSAAESPSHDYLLTPGPHTVCLLSYNQYDCFDSVCKTTPMQTLIKIPNVFTPNNDGKNDVFDIYIEGHNRYELSIYNRWGESVFESNADGTGNDGLNWNGKESNTGRECPPGVYFYTFIYRFSNSTDLHLANGTITLIRE